MVQTRSPQCGHFFGAADSYSSTLRTCTGVMVWLIVADNRLVYSGCVIGMVQDGRSAAASGAFLPDAGTGNNRIPSDVAGTGETWSDGSGATFLFWKQIV